MRVSRGGLNLGVAEQLPDHRQSLAGRHGGRRESVPEIVDPSVLQPGPGTNPLPEGLQITQALPFQSTADDPRVIMDPLCGLQKLDSWLAEMNHLGAGLGVGKVQRRVREIDVLPLECHDFVQTASGQDQQPCGQDRRGKFDALDLHLTQNLADAAELGGAQKPFPLFLGVFLDVLAGIGAVRAKPP